MRTNGSNGTAAGPFADLTGHKYCRLVTFRRNGVPVATPMWFAVDGDHVYMKTEAPSGKLRRIANDPRVELGPCTVAGRPCGAATAGRARVLDDREEARAETVLRGRYGVGRRLFVRLVEPIFRRRGLRSVYLEVASTGALP
jgi:PPOX class probable F420-dependent enzyme